MQIKNNKQKIKILAEVLLTNLPNGFYINAGFRNYGDEIVMLSEMSDGKQIIVPVKAILEYLLQRYKKQNETIEDIVESVGCLLEDIYKETDRKQMLGFDGVCSYLYSKIDKNKTYMFENTNKELKNIKDITLTNHSDDLTYYTKHPLVSSEVREKLRLYKENYKDQTIDPIKQIIEEYNKQVVHAVNSETTDKSKYCTYCTYNLNKCNFVSNFDHKRLPSWKYNDIFNC